MHVKHCKKGTGNLNEISASHIVSSAPFNDNIAISSSSGGERETGFGGKDGYACYHSAELLSVMEETTDEAVVAEK